MSWLALRGKCSACGAAISVRYPDGRAPGRAHWRRCAICAFGPTWQGLAACAFLWTLLALTFIDFDTQLLPDDLTLPLLWGGLLANLFGLFAPLREAVIGAIAGYLSLWSIYWLFKLIRGKEGMGYGDFKLLAALGAWLGWKMLPLIVLGSSVVGAAIGITLVVIQGARPQRSAGLRPLPRDRRHDRAVLRPADRCRIYFPWPDRWPTSSASRGASAAASRKWRARLPRSASESPTPTPRRTR